LYYSMNADARADQPALILIHGAGGEGALWPYHARRLPGWRVFAPDLPGHGSSGGKFDSSVASIAAKLWAWADSLNIDQAVLCGHSLGAAVALEMALAAPLRTRGLALLGAAARFPVNAQLLEKFASPSRTEEGVGLMVKWSFSLGADERLRKSYERQLLACPPGLLHADLRACADFDLGTRAAELAAPCALLVGEEDRMVSPRLSQALADGLRGARLRTLASAGHMMMLEQPAETAQALEGLLVGM
jgi:pimeloyl-ACP methyl ester carboxylesterase